MKLSDNAAGKDKPEDITAAITVSPSSIPDENGIKLFFVENGEPRYIATLRDSGTKGEINGEDLIYEGKFNTAGMKEGRYRLRAVATAKGK